MYGGIPRNQWPGADNGRPDIREKAERDFRNGRLAARQAANSPWPIDPNSPAETADKPEIGLDRESGKRAKFLALLPADMRKPEHRQALELLEFNLMMQFGGYTVEKFRGGWLNPENGEFERDSGQAYNVSFPIDREYSSKAERAIALFTETGRALGEQWIHIEESEFFAEHRRAN